MWTEGIKVLDCLHVRHLLYNGQDNMNIFTDLIKRAPHSLKDYRHNAYWAYFAAFSMHTM